MTYSELFADSARDIYIPQHFAESVRRDMVTGVDTDDWAILEAGPDHESYWDVWESVLDNAELTDGDGVTWVLHQDGDLWLIAAEKAAETLNREIEERVEYDESHIDTGDNYAHMVAESWCSESDQRLRDELGESPDVDQRWHGMDSDTLANIAIDLFAMRAGSIYGPHNSDGIVIDSFHVQEVEISLEHCGVDGIALEYVESSLDAHVFNGQAYMATDAVWYAVVSVDAFNAAIAEYFAD